MLQPLFDSSVIGLLEKMAVFGERRQEALAGNIANIDTPNYKMRDLPVAAFQKALKNAVAGRHQIHSPNLTFSEQTQPAHTQAAKSLAELFPDTLFQASDSQARNITFQDGNNRSIENQVMEMTKNLMMQNFAVELMSAQMHMFETVISERA
jgi:flagellar basal-body rod protein FlgB